MELVHYHLAIIQAAVQIHQRVSVQKSDTLSRLECDRQMRAIGECSRDQVKKRHSVANCR